MSRIDPESAECLVFTYKEGLLSAVAHDLKLRVTRFSIDVDDEHRAIDARFEAASIRVVAAMRDGAEAPAALGEADRRKIEQNLAADVLDAARHPEIRFTSRSVTPDGDGYRVEGDLALHGQTRHITLRTRAEGGRQIAELTLHQPDFGIKPFSAMMGTLRIKPDVRVRIAVPALGGVTERG